ncbi:MAG: hypothetical protein IPL53_18965 [Ignavibacteria bacterium]|nr:hypothetical protein [Ignavibacteria bacterium]
MKRISSVKYILLSLMVLVLTCGYDECATGPGEQNFLISYSPSADGNTKFYFTPPDKFVLQRITSRCRSIPFEISIDFKYPYLACSNSESHLIKEFSNVQKGQVWEFEFFSPGDNGRGILIDMANITIQ